MDAASNNGVDEIRELRDKIAFPPRAGRYKVYIIDEVHMLSIGAFNALLKTLEEPPAPRRVYFGHNGCAEASCYDSFPLPALQL